MIMNSAALTKDLAAKSVSTSEGEAENPLEEILEVEDEMQKLFAAHAAATGQRPL